MAKKKSKKTEKPPLPRQLNYAEGSYLESTSQPLYALLFLLPLIVVYELGTLWVNTQHIEQTLVQRRVVAFIWLSKLAQGVGIEPSWAWAFPGIVVLVILLAWHVAARKSWNIHLPWLGWMTLESLVLALPLLAVNAAMGSSARVTSAAAQAALNAPSATAIIAQTATGALNNGHSYLAHLVTGIGAGIYEELVFRLILIGLIIMILEDLLKVKADIAAAVAIILSALLFSAHHYVGVNGRELVLLKAEPFTMLSFVFRAAAGVYFAILFRYRGYGITAGAHAAYNIVLRTLWP